MADTFRALCAELAEEDEPAVPEVVGSEWQPCVKLPITVHVREQRPGEQHVSTREGITPVQPDDLIMLGVDGEEYPIGRELFQRTYRMGSADEPAVPQSREPASVTEQPSDEEIMGLMPQQMHEDLACAARAMANEAGTDNRKAKGFMRIALNRHAVDLARAVLAHWGNPAPQLPTDGEVAELVEWLGSNALTVKKASGNPANGARQRMNRAAELLERQVPVPVSVSERLPGPSVKVLAHYFNGLGKGRTICAIWVPAKTRSDSYGDDDFTEYDEESDTFYWPEGWYETIENWDDLGYVKVVEGEVIYWQPLPKWYAHALPLPEVGE